MNKKSSPNGTPLSHLNIEISGNEIWEMCDAIVLCSGGMDSVTLAHYVKKTIGMSPALLFFNYGQKTLMREWGYALMCANELHVPMTRIHLSDFTKFVKSAIVEGGEESEVTADTVVPGRNLLFASFAAALAESAGIQDVYIGVQLGDNEGYPDCRPDFWSHLSKATYLAYNVRMRTPFILWNKKKIVEMGKELDVNYDNTWSCYYSNKEPCGKCPSCIVRAEAGV
jgi:7-cyano-7-deazaguanine synthase